MRTQRSLTASLPLSRQSLWWSSRRASGNPATGRSSCECQATTTRPCCGSTATSTTASVCPPSTRWGGVSPVRLRRDTRPLRQVCRTLLFGLAACLYAIKTKSDLSPFQTAPDRNPENIRIEGHVPHEMDINWEVGAFIVADWSV